jgi:predicted SnoaL-like aldol condensation-catalyzing enzyme
LTLDEMKQFVRDHFEEFVNRKNPNAADVNFAPEFVDHGTDTPPGLPRDRHGMKQYVGGVRERIPDLHVTILDLIAEGDKVVAHNRWTGTDTTQNRKVTFGGIVIWRIAHRQLVERWAYLEPPQPVEDA